MNDTDFTTRYGREAVDELPLTWSFLWNGLVKRESDNGKKTHSAATQRQQRTTSTPKLHLAKAINATKAPAISRAVAVLRLLGSSSPLGMQAIARELGIIPSTCHYVLRALLAEELINFDPDTKCYSHKPSVRVPLHSDMVT